MANRALERLGKQQGMFIDRHEVGQPAAGPVNLGSLGPPHRAARPYAQLAGLRVQRTELKTVDQFDSMSDDELRQYVYGNKEIDKD